MSDLHINTTIFETPKITEQHQSHWQQQAEFHVQNK